MIEPTRTILVSNRLPATVAHDASGTTLVPSTGGLATALRGPHATGDSLWVGWPGEVPRLPRADAARLERELTARRLLQVRITASEVNAYYDGFSNGVLWPLFHFLLDKVRLDATRDYEVYREVNARFARTVAEAAGDDDLVWVHDYQLALVPAMLRELRPTLRIGFFLHIPFPPVDVFRILPWREEILRGLLGADLVSFHTDRYRQAFSESVSVLLGVDREFETISLGERSVRLGVHPIGIDVAAFEEASDRPEVVQRALSLKEELGTRSLVLGVDRLDYTKGIPRRLLAVDRLLSDRPELAEKIRFVQIAVPSRERVDAYAELRRSVHELVSRINGRHGTPTSVPVHFLYRSIPLDELVALYRAADVMLVTPLRDGMNLVAKEYAASRTDEGGVLVLSELAGAAAELDAALLVNPYDVSRVAATLERALEMSPAESRARMRALRQSLGPSDCHRWAARFLDDLARVPRHPHHSAEAHPLEVGGAAAELVAASKRVLFLDYDGSLVPHAALPALAVPDPPLRDLLERLADDPRNEVHVVSGRLREELVDFLGGLGCHLHAEHGLASLSPGEHEWRERAVGPFEWKESIRSTLLAFAAHTPGSFVEEKPASFAFHYRRVEPNVAFERVRELRDWLASVLPPEVEILRGSMVIEARLRGIHKGVVAEERLGALEPGTAILAAGDDRTDEDLFAALPASAITLSIGTHPSRARFRLRGPDQLRALLERLARARTEDER